MWKHQETASKREENLKAQMAIIKHVLQTHRVQYCLWSIVESMSTPGCSRNVSDTGRILLINDIRITCVKRTELAEGVSLGQTSMQHVQDQMIMMMYALIREISDSAATSTRTIRPWGQLASTCSTLNTVHDVHVHMYVLVYMYRHTYMYK